MEKSRARNNSGTRAPGQGFQAFSFNELRYSGDGFMAIKGKRKIQLKGKSAYQGGTWSPRLSSHTEECKKRLYWPGRGLNSEFKAVREVLLYQPPEHINPIKNPERVQHLRAIDWK